MPDFIGAARRKWAEMTEAADDYKHAKCYANTRGGCSTKTSGEHYVSHGLIKLYGGNDPDFTVQHKTGKGVGHPVQPKNFKANIKSQLATRSGESTVVPNLPSQPAWIRFFCEVVAVGRLRPLHADADGVGVEHDGVGGQHVAHTGGRRRWPHRRR